MLGQQFGTILARTDPFDVAQGLERHIRSLSADQVRALISAARERMNDWYRAEFLPLLDEPDDERLKSSFAQTLKSNLRAIPLFGPAFCEGVISRAPGDRAVGIGEEISPLRRMRPLAFGAVALALLIGGAAAEHVISTARSAAQTPVVTVTPTPAIVQAAPAPVPVAAVHRQTRPAAIARPAVTAAAPQTPQPRIAAPAPVPAAVPPRAVAARTAPPGSGVKTIVAKSAATPAPSPEPTSVDVSDMPQAFSDATPLPKDETAPPAQVSAPVAVATPTPGPNRSWLHQTVTGVGRTITNLNPFRHHRAPEPTPSPSGPQPR